MTPQQMLSKTTAVNHPKTFYAVNTVYVMKQGTHIQFQLVNMHHKGIKNHSQ